MSTLSDFAAQHWVFGGISASLLWFLAGRQSLHNGKPNFAIFWWVVGVFVTLVLCGGAIAGKEWLGLAIGIIVLYVEVQAIRRASAAQNKESPTSV